jgi:hypothetical protein
VQGGGLGDGPSWFLRPQGPDLRTCPSAGTYVYNSTSKRVHAPPHIYVEYQGRKGVFDFKGNILRGGLNSRTATKLVREWVDLRLAEIEEDWDLASAGKEIKKIEPLE